MAYTWSDDLATGNAIIDGQHKELIEAINKLLEACSHGQGRTQMKPTAEFLLSYTKRHFADEERLQRDSRYPDYTAHKQYHDAFVTAVTALVTEINTSEPSVVLVGKVNTVVVQWLISHIKREDVKVAQHIKSQKT